jgi:O-acetyl-ADP-ribose deacetylase (regulator of RNase III)
LEPLCKIGQATIYLVVGNIADFEGDAVVNPANTLMVMGGGVALALKMKGGGEIEEEEARRHAPVPIGDAVVTGAGRLKARYVIHAPTVERPAGKASRESVYKATVAAVRRIRELGLKRVAFPLMGAGVGGLSVEESVSSMPRAIRALDVPVDIYIYVRDESVRKRAEDAVRSECSS